MGAPGANILAGIKNTSMWLQDGRPGAEEALKFFVHFMGDLHMPLHLTGRSKGGNGGVSLITYPVQRFSCLAGTDQVRWDGRLSSMFHQIDPVV